MCVDPQQKGIVQGKQSCHSPVLLCQLEWEQLHVTQQIGFGLCDAEVIPNDSQTTVAYLYAALFFINEGLIIASKKKEEEAAFRR